MTNLEASLAVYHGSRMSVTEHADVAAAIREADAAVKVRRETVAVVRDKAGVMVYAADSEGRTWNRGEPVRPEWGKHLRREATE